jgi:anion-transporting  ArsA/GET3 family ATPase
MSGMLDRQLVFVTGKGGVGKTTVALALAQVAAARGRRTVLCEVGRSARVPRLYGRRAGDDGVEVEIDHDLHAVSVDPQRALEEYLARNIGRPGAGLLARSNTFAYFVAAAPGARELLAMGKAWDFVQPVRWNKTEGYDLVVVDGPASGHALGMLRAPRTFADIARVGPIARQAGQIRDLLADDERSAVVAVTLPSEMPVAETLDLERRLGASMERRFGLVVANEVLPRRLDAEDLEDLDIALNGDRRKLLRAAREAAASAVVRAESQEDELERLRAGVDAPIVELPFLFETELGLEAIGHLADVLDAEVD